MTDRDPWREHRRAGGVPRFQGPSAGTPSYYEASAAQNMGMQPQPTADSGAMQPAIGMGGSTPNAVSEDRSERSIYVPFVDIIDTADEIRIVIDTPGFEEDDITIEADDGVLIVCAERESEYSGRARNRHIERPQALERTVLLPASADPDTAWAEYKNGTAIVVFDKNESERHHHIGFQ